MHAPTRRGRRLGTALATGFAIATISLLPLGPSHADELSRWRRADANTDGALDVSDPIATLLHLFAGGALSCEDAADANDDGAVDVSDPIVSLGYLFTGGPAPPPPFAVCGGDPTPDALGCDSYPGCPPNAPPTADFSITPETGAAPLTVALDASSSEDTDGAIVEWSWELGDGSTASGERIDHTFTWGATFTITLTVTDDFGSSASTSRQVEVAGEPEPPPDPSTIAPPLDPKVDVDFADSVAFLYSGPEAIQVGVEEGAIDGTRVAVVHGRVITREGEPLANVRVSALGADELGHTRTRVDGLYDLAVNGGGEVTLRYEKSGHLTAQRRSLAPWRDFVSVDDVALVPLDGAVTEVTVDGSAPVQSARGSPVTDADGARQATLVFPAGVTASLELPDGTTTPVSSLSIRATEYSVGDGGPHAMPAALPPRTAYTYCVELSADEAIAAGARTVRFSEPVAFWVEDFLGFPVGSGVPSALYDRETGQWVAIDNGRVVEVLSTDGGVAALDTTGDGVADDGGGLGVTEAELRELATLFPSAPQRLWRVLVPHLTPLDCNHPRYPPPDARRPRRPEPRKPRPLPRDCYRRGSVIECSNQTLSETLRLRGTPLSLAYRSDRVPGRLQRSFEISLTGDDPHPELTKVQVNVHVLGRVYSAVYDPEPNLVHVFDEWDGKDVWGREFHGSVTCIVDILHFYPAYYIYVNGNYYRTWDEVPPGAEATLVPLRTGFDSILAQTYTIELTISDSRARFALGGWSVSDWHQWDARLGLLHLGDGSVQQTGTLAAQRVIDRVPTPSLGSILLRGVVPQGLAVGPDGSLYITDTGWHFIWRILPDGTPQIFAGIPNSFGYTGDGGLAIHARLAFPVALAVGPDESVYIAELGNHVIRRVDTAGRISTVAGTGALGDLGDGGPATDARLSGPTDVCVHGSGDLYIADRGNDRVRRVGPDGRITAFAGDGTSGFSGDGDLAVTARLDGPTGVAVNELGEVFIADRGNRRIRQVGVDGRISTFAGNGLPGADGDGQPATTARCTAERLAWSRAGSLWLTDGGSLVRRIGPEGLITTEAGGADGCLDISGCYGGDGGPGPAAWLNQPKGIAVSPDDEVLFVDGRNFVVRSLASPLPFLSSGDLLIPRSDGSEIYQILADGRHRRTLEPITGATLRELHYDDEGRLSAITDGEGHPLATFERDAVAGDLTIIGEHGHETVLTFDENGYLSTFTDPTDARWELTHSSDGLLRAIVDPEDRARSWTYDELGRLVGEENAEDGSTSLVSETIDRGHRVTVTTAAGRDTTYDDTREPDGSRSLSTQVGDCVEQRTLLRTDGSKVLSHASGVTRESLEGPEPRWGMQAPIETELRLTTPNGLVSTVEREDTAILTLPGNPLSLLAWTSTHDVDGRTWRRVITVSPDGYSRVTTTPEGREVRRQSDAYGRPTSVQRGDLAAVTMSYDSLGRLTELRSGVGDRERVTTLDYGAERYLASLTDPTGRITSYEYDDAGRLTAWLLPGARRLELARDRLGAPVALVTPRGTTHELRRSARGLVSRYIPPPNLGDPPEAYAVEYEHDGEGLVTRIAWPDGRAVFFEHGCGGRLERASFPSGEIVYTYDADRNTIAQVARSGHVDLSVTHDGPLVTRQAWSGAVSGRVDTTYSPGFLVDTESVNGAQPIDLALDGDELLVQAGDLSLTRTAASGLLESTEIGDIVTAHEHDEFGAPTRIRAERDGVPFLDVVRERDLRGRITRSTETIDGATATWDYTYDVAGRLETATLDAGGTLETYVYGYDANGNRTSVTSPTGSAAGVFDAQDRLLSLGETSLSWSPCGQLLSRTDLGSTTEYEHDVFGNLLGVDLPDGTRIDYVVDGLHRRVGKKIDGTLVSGLLYRDDLRPAAELDGLGDVVSRFVYAADGGTPSYFLSRKEDGTTWRTYRVLTDANGSVRLVVEVDAGALRIVERIDYTPWGEVTLDTRPGFQPFGFAGGLLDPDTRLVRLGRRDYDPSLGQWISRDPLLFAGGDPNLYAYALGDPINHVDPFGMASDRAHCREWWKRWWERFLREFARKWRDLGKGDPYDLGREGQELLEDISDALDAMNDLNDLLDEFGLGIDLPWPAAMVPDMLGAGVEVLRKGTKIFDDYHEGLGGIGVHANADGTTGG